MPARLPLITRIERRPWPNQLLTWIQSPQPAPQAIPPSQKDWQNPNLGKPYPIDLRTWIRDPLPAPNAFPAIRMDWPNPFPLPPNLELRRWIQDPIPTPQAIPPSQTDWPNPQLLRRYHEYFGWSQSAPVSPGVPINQYDWQNPQRSRSSFDFTWIQSGSQTVPSPVNQYDWPNPVLARVNLDLRGWIQSPIPTPTPIPISQSNWPNPPPLPPNLELRTWTQLTPQGFNVTYTLGAELASFIEGIISATGGDIAAPPVVGGTGSSRKRKYAWEIFQEEMAKLERQAREATETRIEVEKVLGRVPDYGLTAAEIRQYITNFERALKRAQAREKSQSIEVPVYFRVPTKSVGVRRIEAYQRLKVLADLARHREQVAQERLRKVRERIDLDAAVAFVQFLMWED